MSQKLGHDVLPVVATRKKRSRGLSPYLWALALGLAGPVSAADWYADLSVNYGMIDVDTDVGSADFDAAMLEARVGAYLEPMLGLEVHAGTGLGSGEDIDIETKLNYNLGVAARFESPELEGGKVFFLLGYSMSEFDMDRSGTGEPGAEQFDGFSYGGGLEFRLGESAATFLNLKVLRYHGNDGISLDAAGLGLRHAF